MTAAANYNSFDHFYASWSEQLRQLVNQLSVARHDPAPGLSGLVDKFMGHYAEYYRAKRAETERDVLSVVATPWATSLERSLHWIAGWRPATIFHLIYTESSILFESHIMDILHGVHTGDLGDLSPSQFRRVSELQCETVREENAITEELSQWQDSASGLVAVAATASDVDAMVERLASAVKKADNLRLTTVRKVVELLNPRQATEFLVAAAEMQFGLRAWGLNQEASA